MNEDIIQGNWKQVKGKLKKQWGKLTDDQIEQMTGTYEELKGAIQKAYGYEQEKIEDQIESFIEDNEWK